MPKNSYLVYHCTKLEGLFTPQPQLWQEREKANQLTAPTSGPTAVPAQGRNNKKAGVANQSAPPAQTEVGSHLVTPASKEAAETAQPGTLATPGKAALPAPTSAPAGTTTQLTMF